MTSKLILKNYLATCFHLIGSFKLLSSYKRVNKAFVLMYHRVLPSPLKDFIPVQPGMYVSTCSFRRQAIFLRERFDVLPLSELVNRIESGRSVGGCCSITFDDGWYDNFTQSFPILQEFRLPATIFLATGFIGTDRVFWPEELLYYLQQPEMRTSAGLHPVLARFISNLTSIRSDEEFREKAVLTMKTFSSDEREEVFSQFRSICSSPLHGKWLMNWEEVRKMKKSGLVNFGAHTANHVILDQVSLQEAEREIIQSRKELENQLSVRPELFAYPNGNYNRDLPVILLRNNFKGAVNTHKKWFGKEVPLFGIPRIGIHEDVSCTIPLFFARILLKRF